MKTFLQVALLAVALTASGRDASAQDTRQVAEPMIPPACTILLAQLSSRGKGLADSDENYPDTERIQKAIDACPAGHAVELRAKGEFNAFLSGPLQLRTGVTLLVDLNTVLFGSRNPRDYDVSPGSCGVIDEKGHGCKALISGEDANDAGVMGEGAIDGRGGAKLLGQNVSWWDLAQEAKVKKAYQNCPRLIMLVHCNNFTLYQVTLRNPGNYHVFFSNGNGFTAWGVKINTPRTARNTDGIDPASSTNVTITHCYIHTGDDQVAIKANTGGPSSHMTIAHNHFYTGHGMSIGSETEGGVSAIRVSDLSIDGADNGLRIKSNSSRGGQVSDVVYQDVCIRNTKNPILMDSNYPYPGGARNKFPSFTGIVLRNVRILGGGKLSLQGFDAAHRLQITLDDVSADGLSAARVTATHAQVTLGPGPVNFRPSGDDVQVTGTPGASAPASCRDKFVPMPAH
ncbi:MAG TPA: glycosyl hydrolase family 28 protein [Terriglobia bacterium]|nr:glycosyl hydrolase family 28 protein [Terriglobia bacterium]